jgi:biopolymer transport protein ExbB
MQRLPIIAYLLLLMLGATSSVPAQEAAEEPTAEPRSIDELVDFVKRGYSVEREENRAREERFRLAKDEQADLLAEARAELAREEAAVEGREQVFAANEAELADTTSRLDDRVGNLGELFGVVRQVAGDLQSHAHQSLTTSQIGDRTPLLEKLGRSQALPTTGDLEALWYELLREISEQGKVVRYPAEVLSADGGEERREVTRAGVFSVVSDGRYMHWDPEIQRIRELNRQPPSRYLETVSEFESPHPGKLVGLALDPTRGSLLSALIETPSLDERIGQGGAVGYTIIAIGLVALAVGFWKWWVLFREGRKVQAQQGRSEAREDNPLGRVLRVFEANRGLDPEALELKLDQAVISEAEHLDRLVWLVRVVSVVAPLLGLLGTVTGMIQTFQAITLFGAGDPKMMAGGISEALVTTMLGLITAAPLVLLHAFLSTSKRRILSVLNGESAGLVAMRLEDSHA